MANPTPLEKLRRELALAVGENAVFDGWARQAVDAAAGQLGLDPVQARLAMPQNIPLALRISWRSADLMWRIAGDTNTDFNHYTKRMTLGAVYGSTLLAWLDDESEGWMETGAFLDRRIDDVMKIEKWKAEWRGSSDQRLSVSRFLGRLRYPPR